MNIADINDQRNFTRYKKDATEILINRKMGKKLKLQLN